MKENKIKDIVDKYLKFWVDNELNQLPGIIEAEMADPNQDVNEEWRIWYPIDSKVSDQEIIDLENLMGYKLPDDYKVFLKHKHFYELQISEASFCKHPVNIWRAHQTEMIFNGYPKEFLINKGLIPFAEWSDYGLLCFNSNKNENTDYPIVLWDHEAANKPQEVYKNFYELIVKLDMEAQENIS